MEGLVTRRAVDELGWYRGRRVLVTGHTGFKGSWLTLWLTHLGAAVTGLALPAARPSMYEDVAIDGRCESLIADVRDPAAVAAAVRNSRPDVIFHLAAQALVLEGYRDPATTFSTNLVGVVDLLEAVRARPSPVAVVVVTSDKCYGAAAAGSPRREDDRLGGRDPYSASKAAVELIVEAYRSSFFPPDRVADHGVALATARAGNVIGGGDWAADRIVPDAIRALRAGRPIPVRNPSHVRPWQHVLEPLMGYLTLGTRLAGPEAARYAEAWNFGPDPATTASVRELVARIVALWGSGSQVETPSASHVEAPSLVLAIDKAHDRLGWRPRWGLDEACARTVQWYRAHAEGRAAGELERLSIEQIEEYSGAAALAMRP